MILFILVAFAFICLNLASADIVCDNSSVDATYCQNNQTIMTCSLIIVSGNETYNWTASNCTSGKMCSNASCVNIPAQTANCTENWTCANWSICANSAQTRTCTEQNSCNTTLNRPAVNQSCSVSPGTQNCTNECPIAGKKTCEGESSYRNCGNYDSDSCLELGNVTSCPADKVCLNGNCVTPAPVYSCSMGARNGTKFCSSTRVWEEQKADGKNCSSSYECVKNKCSSGKCGSGSNIVLYVIIVLVLLAIMGVVLFFVMRRKKSPPSSGSTVPYPTQPASPSPPVYPQPVVQQRTVQPVQPRPQPQFAQRANWLISSQSAR